MNAPIHYLETTNPLTAAEAELAQLSAQIDAATHRQLTLKTAVLFSNRQGDALPGQWMKSSLFLD